MVKEVKEEDSVRAVHCCSQVHQVISNYAARNATSHVVVECQTCDIDPDEHLGEL